MAAQWGRKETVVWPPNKPIYSYGAALMALIMMVSLIWVRFTFAVEPLRQFYTSAYIRSAFGGAFKKHGTYQVLYVAGPGKENRIARPEDVQAGSTEVPVGKPLPIELSAAAKERGARLLYRDPKKVLQDKAFHAYLASRIWQGESLTEVYGWSFECGFGTLLVLLCFSIPRDIKRRKEMKYGRLLKGPEMVAPAEFNKQLGGDGMGIRTDGKGLILRIPKRSEPSHIQIMGDTGVGKSTLIVQMLRQIEERNQLAIVYDPSGELIQRFYREDREDIVLNPLDARSPYWSPASELRTPAEARTIAASLYQPTSDRKGEFFTETPQKIFAHLLKYKPTPQDLVAWMSNPDEIDRRVAGTELASIIAKGAEQQRAGVLASLGLIADSLKLLPTKKQAGNREWSATEWSEKRKGWIFLTGTEAEQEALRPLHSLWIDLLILRNMTLPKPGQTRAWFVLDEVATLQRLPQFHSALTKNRKSENPIIFTYQGKAQIEVPYGHLAQTMLSMPSTKYILKTAEPEAAKWASQLIGDVEIERVRETLADGKRAGKSFTLDRQVEPLVMPSEIGGLSNLHAFVKQGNYVSRFSFPHMDLPIIAEALVKREENSGDFWLKEPGTPTPPTAGPALPAEVPVVKKDEPGAPVNVDQKEAGPTPVPVPAASLGNEQIAKIGPVLQRI